jgi:hypothetical protein
LGARRYPPTVIRHERKQQPKDHSYQRSWALPSVQVQRCGADHDHYQRRCRQWRQAGSNAKNPWQNQPNPAEYFGASDEMQEPTWQCNLLGHLCNWDDELHDASEHEKHREQYLQDPK